MQKQKLQDVLIRHAPCFLFTLLPCLFSFSVLSLSPLEPMLVSPTQPYPPPMSPSFTTLSSITHFPFLRFQYEQLYSGDIGVELSHSDGGNINQVMHIGRTDAREEERSLFTHFRLIALSLFPRLFCHCMFIYHSAAEPELHCSALQSSLPSHLSLYRSCSPLLMSSPCQSCLF